MEETMSIQDVLKILKRRLLLIISFTIFTVGIAIVLNFYYITPIYQAQTQILLNQKGDTENPYSWALIETDIQLISTYNDIITSPVILDKVIEQLKLDKTQGQLSSQITLSSVRDSKVFRIIVQDPDPQQAVIIANGIAEVFKDEVPSLLNVDNINILAAAKLSENPSPIKPDKALNVFIGAIIGLILGVGVSFIIELLDTTIKDEKDVEELLGIPIMGIIGLIPIEREKKSSLKTQRLRGVQNVWIEK